MGDELESKEIKKCTSLHRLAASDRDPLNFHWMPVNQWGIRGQTPLTSEWLEKKAWSRTTGKECIVRVPKPTPTFENRFFGSVSSTTDFARRASRAPCENYLIVVEIVQASNHFQIVWKWCWFRLKKFHWDNPTRFARWQTESPANSSPARESSPLSRLSFSNAIINWNFALSGIVWIFEPSLFRVGKTNSSNVHLPELVKI